MKRSNTPFYIFVISLIGICCLTTISCERDDICNGNETPITPFLIITFEDADPQNMGRKPVQRLQVTLTDTDKTVFRIPINIDSIAIPLATFKDSTKYTFTRNFDAEDTTTTASDDIEFTYSRNNEFVNRACGFRTTFDNLDRKSTTTNWIQNITIDKTTVNDQVSAHIRLFH